MATRLKTVEYAFPVLASVVNNTLTDFTQITINLPDVRAGSNPFLSATLRITADDIITATGGSLTTKTIALRLGAITHTSTTNANTLTHSGQSISFLFVRDFTAHFNTNWSGTSMTCDARLQINQSTGTTLGLVNVCARLYITYEYDDTSATQIKTVYIPLDAPVGALAITRPSSLDTIPALDTYLPEASKTYYDSFVWFGANTCVGSGAVSHQISFQIDDATAYVTGNYEAALATTSRWTEHIWKPTFTTNATHEFRMWTSVGDVDRHHHPQVYLVVTYGFTIAGTTRALNSVILPMEWESPAGTSSTIFQRATRQLMIQEPGTINTRKVALYVNYETPLSLGVNLNCRISTGSFIAYTEAGSVVCGQKGLMIRNDSAFTLARGRNTLQADMHGSTTVSPFNISSFWIVNYESDIATQGIGAHNHTIRHNIHTHGTGAATLQAITAALSFIPIPETNYYITAAGTVYEWMTNSTISPSGVIVQIERLASGESGLKWETAYVDNNACDPEVGIHSNYSQVRTIFNRWKDDPDTDRINILSSRRFRMIIPNTTSGVAAWHLNLSSLVTYHTITYTVSGTITNSSGGTVSLSLHRTSSGEKILIGSRVGNGAYSFTWYDNTEDIHVVAKESGTLLGRSDDGLAT